MGMVLWLTAVLANEPQWSPRDQFYTPTAVPTVAEELSNATAISAPNVDIVTAKIASETVGLSRTVAPVTPLFVNQRLGVSDSSPPASSLRQLVGTDPMRGEGLPISARDDLVTFLYQARPARDRIAGCEISLCELLNQIDDSTERLRVITAYWVLATRLARYHLALDGVTELTQLSDVSAADEEILAEAIGKARERSHRNHIDAIRSQYRMVTQAGLGEQLLSVDDLPLPNDRPFVDLYPSRLQGPGEISIQRVKQLRQSLVDRQSEVEHQVGVVVAAMENFTETADRYQSKRGSIQDVMAAHVEWYLEREHFLASVLRYNMGIGRCVLAITERRCPPGIVVNLLLPRVEDGFQLGESSWVTRRVSAESTVPEGPVNRLKPVRDVDALRLLPVPEPPLE